MGIEKPVLLSEESLSEPHVDSVTDGTFSYFIKASPVGNGANEDAMLVMPCGKEGTVLAVADGVGGSRLGHVASRTALQAIEASVNQALKEEHSIRTGILNGFEKANQDVLALGVGAATTLALAEISGNSCRPYHVGDSFVAVIGNRGKQRLLTIDHSPVGYGVEAGLIEEHDAIQHEERNIVSNVLGSQEMRIEIGPIIELKPLDTVFLATDGVSDNLKLQEIVDCIRAGDVGDCANGLVSQIIERMEGKSDTYPSKPDDFSFILFRPRKGVS